MLQSLLERFARPQRAPGCAGGNATPDATSKSAAEDEVLGLRTLLELVLAGAGTDTLLAASQVSKAWRAVALEAARVYTYAHAPALAAALDTPALHAVAWLRLAHLAHAGAMLQDHSLPLVDQLRDFALLLELRDEIGVPVFGTLSPLHPPTFGASVSLMHNAVCAKLPTLPLWPDVISLKPLLDTGAPNDLRRLRCSVSFVRLSTAEVACAWRDVPASNLTSLLQGKIAQLPTLHFSLHVDNVLPQGDMPLPPCAVMRDGMVYVLGVEARVTFSTAQSMPGIPWRCAFNKACNMLRFQNIDTGAMVAAEGGALLRVMRTLDWQPLAPPLEAAASMASLSLSAPRAGEADEREAEALWPAHVAAMRALPAAVRARLPPRPFLAMQKACARAARETQEERELRCRAQKVGTSYMLLTEVWEFDPDIKFAFKTPVCGAAALLRTHCCADPRCFGFLRASTRDSGGCVAAPPPPPPAGWSGPEPRTLLLMEQASGSLSAPEVRYFTRHVRSGAYRGLQHGARMWTALLRIRPDGSVQLAHVAQAVPLSTWIGGVNDEAGKIHLDDMPSLAASSHDAAQHAFYSRDGMPPHAVVPSAYVHTHLRTPEESLLPPPEELPILCAVRLVLDAVHLGVDVLTDRAHADAEPQLGVTGWRFGSVSHMDSAHGLRMHLFATRYAGPSLVASQRVLHSAACLDWTDVLPARRTL